MGEINKNNSKNFSQGGNTPKPYNRPQTEVDLAKIPQKVVSARPVEGVKMHLPKGKLPQKKVPNKRPSLFNKIKNKLLFKKSVQEKEREAREVEFIPEDLIGPGKFLKELRLPIIMISLTAVLMILAYSSLTAYKLRLNKVVKEIDEEIATVKFQISNYKKVTQEVENFQSSVKLAKEKLDTHIYWTKFFEFLEKYTLKNVNFIGFSGDNTGMFVLPVVTDSYDSLAKQLVAFRGAKEFVKAADITSGGKELTNEEGAEIFITSSITLEVLPEVFIIKEE